ncbi:2OG-Fe(II) oxygenase superfamily protein [Xylariaceae sp. FL1651]|nr:2OG-Fe(II) oxygenase superfamily protein [Xylariaceae sp. FL1651]
MTTSFDVIPTIDLSLANDTSTLPQLLQALRHALINVGFLYVSNHGVPPSVIADLVAAMPELFTLGADAKRAVAFENSPHFLGYSGVGSETTGGKADLREQFEFATELSATWREGLPLYERLRGPNQWPDNNAKLRCVIERYLSELTQLGLRFLDLVAQALSLPDGTFRSFLSDQHRLKLVHYPKSSSPSSNQGVGPHKDSSGWWTFLLQASPPEVKGLQVLNKTGDWVDVPVVPGTFVVNIGQAFEVVTGGVCKATTHRVLAGQRERFSVPFFQGVRRDLTKAEAVSALKEYFTGSIGGESAEGSEVDSAFLRGKYDTWGESQLRTKIRSHRENGRKFYDEVYEKYINDDAS